MIDPTIKEPYTETVVDTLLTNENKNMNWHSLRTYALLTVIAVIAVLQYIHAIGSYGSFIDVLLPILLMAEHSLQGNTGTN